MSGGDDDDGSSSAPMSQGPERVCASTSPNTAPVSVAARFQAALPVSRCRFWLAAVVSTKLRVASVVEYSPLPRGLGPMSDFHLPVGGATSPTALWPLAAFHQSQLAAFVQSAWPFQVASGVWASSTMMLLRRTT